MTIAPERMQAVAAEPGGSVDPSSEQRLQPAGVLRLGAVTVAGGLASASAAWLAGSLIKGVFPVVIALLGVAIGSSLTYLAVRVGRPALGFAVGPIASVVGAALVAPEAGGGTANLPGLVLEAIRGGGLLQPPIAFDPGWRFILVVLFAIVASGSISTAMALEKPRLAVAIPLPLIAGAALLQPERQAVAASVVAVVALIGGLAVAFGADAGSLDTKQLARSFEIRRLLRGAVLLVAVVVGTVLLAQASFLFPTTQTDRIIPPRKPPAVPMEPDRELFVVAGDFRGPVRVGVLDEYDGESWLLPPGDPSRLRPITGERIPADLVPSKLAGADARRISIRITDMSGESLPVPGGLVGIERAGSDVSFDPRVGVPRLGRRLPQGLSYTAIAAPTPLAARLNAAPDPPLDIAAAFTTVPPAPSAVLRLLGRAPSEPFTKIQFLREQLYRTVELSGGGGPIDLTPARVAELLKPDALATPYEVTAVEALLGRWAGVPSRIGYGYFGGDRVEGGYSFRPKHGRVWLESYFEGYGWVPLVGTPPRAAASLTDDAKLQDATVRPSDDLLMVVYVPVRNSSLRLLFELVRYWVFMAAIVALGIVLLVAGYPAALKALRALRRRRWGPSNGHLGIVLAAYATFRDRCNDLNVGGVRDSPLAFVERFDPDEEHDELAWLVTRLFWADIRRDVHADDAEAALGMIASVEKRIAGARSPFDRLLAATSRASLRDPYSDEVPNLYPRPVVRARSVWAAIRARLPRVVGRRSRRLGRASATLLLVLLIGGCAKAGPVASAPLALPPHLPPELRLGLRFVEEPEGAAEYEKAGEDGLVETGVVYSIHQGKAVQGALQVAVLKRDVDARSAEVRRKIEEGIGGAFSTYRFGTVRVRFGPRPQQRLYLWFPPERNAMMLLVLRNEYDEHEELVRRLVTAVRGIDVRRLTPVASGEG